AYPFFNGFNQLLYNWPLHSRPISNLVDHRLSVFMQKFLRRTRPLVAPWHVKNILQISVRRQIYYGQLFRGTVIELPDSRLHLVGCNVCPPFAPDRIHLAELARDAVHVFQLGQRAPAAISLPPSRSWRQPHSKRLRKIFIRMFLGVPSRHVPYVISRERHRPVVIPIRAPEPAENLLPLRPVI